MTERIEDVPPESERAVRVSAGSLLLAEKRMLRDIKDARDDAVDEAVAGVARHDRMSKAALLALLLLASRSFSDKSRTAIIKGRQYAREVSRKRVRAELAAAGVILSGVTGHASHRAVEDFAHGQASADALAVAWRATVIHAATRARRREESVVRAVEATRARNGGVYRTAATETAQAYNDEHAVAARELTEQQTLGLAAEFIIVRRWDARLDACPVCGSHNGEVVALWQSFDGDEPGHAHPHCRCIATLIRIPKSTRLAA